MNKPIVYRIPASDHWRSDLVSESFVRVQLAIARRTHEDTDKDLATLETDINNIQQEIKGKWALANANTMRAFEQRLREIRRQRSRIFYWRKRAEQCIDTILDIGKKRGWKL